MNKPHWTVLEHLPHNPDLSPCNYHLFGFLEEALGGERFSNDEKKWKTVRNWLRPAAFYEARIKKTASAMAKMDISGFYVEK